ncbi:AAA family ATPase [Enterovibrio norvegicus]|uniref:Predicted ATPase n=1 Tax=Enterovibrio norvegicus DSM 15893 TaxID=1121869 RepID=A0A1I5T5M4_9GAMM|nr:ATP-binding protein [Enterovibrio norvegicus]SFP78258.1 Predicted ATPase [Enterovibrio norvegicus DSM 15893]
MINSVWIDNFKSLVDFELPLSKFNCVVGLNGSGKSTILQAMDFISQLMCGEVEEWLNARNWDSSDLNSKLTKKSNIEFKVGLKVDGKELSWQGSFNRSSLSCTKESIYCGADKILSVEDGSYIYRGTKHKIIFDYQGSILSRLKDNQQGTDLKNLKEVILNIRSLDLISPELLRSQNRSADGKLGLGGEKLSAFIHESGTETADKLREELKKIYPQLDEIRTKSLRSGWKQLEINEKFNDRKVSSTARHVNDGMLRLMAVLLQLQIGKAFLLFDEIENGINPELIEYLIDHLVKSNDQIMVTTHSPMVLNFMDDDVAKDSVIYLYKDEQGQTKSKRLFDIPSMAKKLDFMGPGEVFIDTDLTKLWMEITDMSSES